MSYRATKVGNFLRIKHGFAFKSEFFESTGKDLVLTPGNFRIGGGLQLRPGKDRFYSGPFSEDFRLEARDLLIAMTDLTQGAPILGSPLLIPEEGSYLHNQRLGKVVDLEESLVDRNYLYFLFVWDGVRAQIRASATGATVRHTAPDRVYQVDVPLPSLVTQRKIASILFAYDDLIENNRQRINLLEEMAQRLYREWFVDFRYPGRGGVEMVDSDLGPIPEHWEVASLGSRFSVILGGTPSRKRPEYWTDGTVPWINSGKVNDRRVIEPTALITEEALRSSNARLMPRRTTVVAITGATLGQVSLLEIDASANQSVVGIADTSGADSEWLFLAVNAGVDRLVGAASGGAQQHINKGVVESFRVVMPGPGVRERFAFLIRPLFDEVAILLRANRTLEVTRNHLLPTLISGHIDVDDLDISTEVVAA